MQSFEKKLRLLSIFSSTSTHAPIHRTAEAGFKPYAVYEMKKLPLILFRFFKDRHENSRNYRMNMNGVLRFNTKYFESDLFDFFLSISHYEVVISETK